MGYYLDMSIKDGKNEHNFIDIGGKFFGYLDDEEYSKCASAKFLACCCGQEVYDLLNVAWSCISFTINSYAAEVFLKLYRDDLEKFKQNYFAESLDEAIEFVTNDEYYYDSVVFSMG